MIRGVSRVFSRSVRQYTVTSPAQAAAAPETASQLTLNFSTPHTPVYTKKTVDKVVLPGAAGEYGVTAGHSPIISELKPGVVSVIHLGGEVEKFFVPGGFALTHPNSVTDVSVTEAIPLSEFDESAIKAGHANAVRAAAGAQDGSVAKATAQIEIDTFAALARAIGVSL